MHSRPARETMRNCCTVMKPMASVSASASATSCQMSWSKVMQALPATSLAAEPAARHCSLPKESSSQASSAKRSRRVALLAALLAWAAAACATGRGCAVGLHSRLKVRQAATRHCQSLLPRTHCRAPCTTGSSASCSQGTRRRQGRASVAFGGGRTGPRSSPAEPRSPRAAAPEGPKGPCVSCSTPWMPLTARASARHLVKSREAAQRLFVGAAPAITAMR
mmetsp:Transcript_111564/g.346177  ORF Transcript_111564/g.346177 Transcript_111564/m.346177 type:complete len:221 (+) Transcript_111564:251-913(+)